MLAVTDSFKKAIKQDNREIYGYVEVEYEHNDFDLSVTKIPEPLDMVSEDSIIQGNKHSLKYATLENDYTLLDGSFMVWNENVLLDGSVVFRSQSIVWDGSQNVWSDKFRTDSFYASNDIFEDIADNEIIITNNSSDVATKGITIYFKDNLPFDFTVTITTTDDSELIDNVENNQSYIYQYLFGDEIFISSIAITFNNVEFPERRLRITSIDLNLSDMYEGDELLNFEITEELDLLLEKLPINTCTINLNNYPDANGKSKFDILNPQGIIQYLTDNVNIKPYLGILTEDNGIEYVPMGLFYLSDWKSETDGSVTLNGSVELNKFKGKQIIVNTDFMYDYINAKNLETMIKNQADIEVNFPAYSYQWVNEYLKNTDLFDYLSHLIPYYVYYDNLNYVNEPEFRKFYTDRYGAINLNKINTNYIDKLDRKFLTQDLDYQTLNNIKYLIIKYNEYTADSGSNRTVLNENHILGNTEEYVWFTIRNDYEMGYYINSFTYSVISGSGSATLVGHNDFMILVKFTGTIGSELNINCNSYASNSRSVSKTQTINNTNIAQGDTITIDLTNYGFLQGMRMGNIDCFISLYFKLSQKYKIIAETMGDPSLELGDTVAIQTRYTDVNNGYKNMIITKQQFTFDGGLQCHIEGSGS